MIHCNELVTKTDLKIKFSSYIRKFRMELLRSHIWLTASSYMVKYLHISPYTVLGSPSSYMTLQLLHSESPYKWGKSYFLFYQCSNLSYITIYILNFAALLAGHFRIFFGGKVRWWIFALYKSTLLKTPKQKIINTLIN